MKGLTGQILVVDLTSRCFHVEEPPETVYRRYLGGYGLGAWYLYAHIPPGADPLGPDNVLGFTPGLLTGTAAPFSGRYSICAKSPLTGTGPRTNGGHCNGGWGNANSGGTFGPAIKRAGFDAIFFHGQASAPVYLLITPQGVSIEDASALWGKDALETDDELQRLHGDKAAVAAIGVAGEKLSLISGVVNDRGRIAARSGLGAVMGSKRLKALCLVGQNKIEYADPAALREATKKYNDQVRVYASSKLMKALGPLLDHAAPVMRLLKMAMAAEGKMLPMSIGGTFGGAALGTTMTNVMSSQNGDSPVQNYKGIGYLDFPMKHAMKLRGKALLGLGQRQYGCHSCPLRCGYILRYDKLPYADKETHRPEYETCCSFGPLILNHDLDALLQINEYLNRAGLDSISAGGLVAYTLECVEAGLLKKEDFACADYPEGFLPTWGDPTYLLPLVKLIATREGIGGRLADGAFFAAQRIPGSAQLAITANGSTMGMHDLRLSRSYAMSLVSDPSPGRHTAAHYGSIRMGMTDFFPPLAPLVARTNDPREQGRASAAGVALHQVMESLGLCMFSLMMGPYPLLRLVRALTGWEMEAAEVLAIGARIQALRQMFNAREGAIRHEISPRGLGQPPLAKGPVAGVTVDPAPMIAGYYEGMGYGPDGVPTAETLRRCGLDELVADLPSCTGAPLPGPAAA